MIRATLYSKPSSKQPTRKEHTMYATLEEMRLAIKYFTSGEKFSSLSLRERASIFKRKCSQGRLSTLALAQYAEEFGIPVQYLKRIAAGEDVFVPVSECNNPVQCIAYTVGMLVPISKTPELCTNTYASFVHQILKTETVGWNAADVSKFQKLLNCNLELSLKIMPAGGLVVKSKVDDPLYTAFEKQMHTHTSNSNSDSSTTQEKENMETNTSCPEDNTQPKLPTLRQRVDALAAAIDHGLTCSELAQTLEKSKLPFIVVERLILKRPVLATASHAASTLEKCFLQVGVISVSEVITSGTTLNIPSYWGTADVCCLMQRLVENRVAFSVNANGQIVLNN